MTIKGISFKQDNGFDISTDNELLLERVGRILMTYQGERVNNPKFGSLLEQFLFNHGNMLKQHVDSNLKNTIEQYEPRVIVTNVSCTYDKHEAYIKIDLMRRDNQENLTWEETIEL